jgi:hypothetical protein
LTTDGGVVIVACETLKDELELIMRRNGCNYPVVWVESGLHAWPEKLKARIVELVAGLDAGHKTVLLLFGFCGTSLVGLEAGNRTLVMPFVSDCIPIFLGSNERRCEFGIDTYFFTKGYLRGEKNVVNEFGHYAKRYGPQRALRILKKLLEHYRRFAVVDTGAFEVEPVTEDIRKVAEILELPVVQADGNLSLIEDLLKGDWTPERFLVVPPNGGITFEDSVKAGKSQIL